MIPRSTSFFAGLALAAAFVMYALADGPEMAMPDPVLTPGAVASTDLRDICGRVGGRTYTRRHRVWDRKAETLARYGLPLGQARYYEDDDRVPVCAGGDNADPRNHWAEPLREAHEKDKLEAKACRLVCEGKVPLGEAQGWFLGDFREQMWRVQ